MIRLLRSTFILGVILCVFVLAIFILNANKVFRTTADQKDVVTASRINEADQITIATKVLRSENVTLPLSGIISTNNVSHTVPLEEIKRGCFRIECIPSVDQPQFISIEEANLILSPDSIGISLSYKGVHRFYPFPMLETHELVNDVVAGDPLLITYCPLCGTGIVFDRRLGDTEIEFGVSGMLWQSNLLMYNRASDVQEQNLWSQILGEAVVGERAGETLTMIPSEIMKFSAWAHEFREGKVLITGNPQDPYKGAYYETARLFEPSYSDDETLSPEEYVYGVILDEQPVAFVKNSIQTGPYTIGGQTIQITRGTGNQILFSDHLGGTLPDVEGFWFSWKAAHPDTIIVTQ